MKRLIFYTLACLALHNGLSGQSLPENSMGVHPLPIGAMVPDIGLVSAAGDSVDMKFILNGMPTVLVFYRGGWCPYCNRQLADLAVVEKDLKAMGYQVVAVSPDVPERLRESQDKGDLGYRLFSDASGKLIRAMGLGYKVPENYRDIIRKASDGQNEDLLPAPAVFLVDGQAKITFSYMNPDFKQRLSGEALVQAAKAFRGRP